METPVLIHLGPVAGMSLLAICILLVAFFSSSEASLISVNKLRIRHLAEQGNRRAHAVLAVLENHEKFFATILFTENAFIILGSSLGTALAIDWFGGSPLTVGLASGFMTVAIVAFGEITPKSLAVQASERWSLIVAPIIKVIMSMETWVIYLYTLPPKFVTRVIGGKHKLGTPTITEGELQMIIEMSRDHGVVEHHGAEIMRSVLDFGDRAVREVMTPRTEIVWIEDGMPLADFLRVYSTQTFTRFPVYEDSQDNVIGIVSIKDVLRAMGRDEMHLGDPVTEVLRPAYFVPESKKMGNLLKELVESPHIQMTMVVDEYGGIAGLVTMKSIIGEVVGPGAVEESGEAEYRRISENVFHVEGGMRIGDANERLGMQLPEGDYETLAGLILNSLSHLPTEGEHVRLPGVEIAVAEMAGLKVKSVRVTLMDSNTRTDLAEAPE